MGLRRLREEGVGRGKSWQGVKVLGVVEEVVYWGQVESFVVVPALFAPGRVCCI